MTTARPPIKVTICYLEMLDPGQLRPKRIEHPDVQIHQAKIACPAFSRFLYTSVGGPWHWTDRLSWNDDQWMSYLDRPQVQTWVAYRAGTPAGYIELEHQPGDNVEIAYFGLLPQFFGLGLGGHLLTIGTQQAWAMGAQRVWVHTCSLDGPYAYQNYQSRGFIPYDTKVILKTLPPLAAP